MKSRLEKHRPGPQERMHELSAYIASQRERFLEELCALLRQPSISTRGEGVEACAELLVRLMRSSGIRATRFTTPGFPIVYGEVRAPHPAPTVLIYGHYDVQPPEPLDLWRSPPFAPALRNGRLYARGAGDNKGQFFAHLKAVAAILKVRKRLPVNVKFLLEGEEEIGSLHLPGFVQKHRALLAADLAFSSDGPAHPSGPVVFLGCRGLLYLDLKLSGARRDLHSGNYGGLAPNAATRMAQALGSLWDPRGRVAIRGFYDRVRPPTAEERKVLRAIPFDARAFRADAGRPLPFPPGQAYERLLFTPNLGLAGISSGYGGPGTKTIIPAQAGAKLEVRLVPDQEPQEVLRKIRAHFERHGFGDLRITELYSVPPSRTPLQSPFAQAAMRAVRSVWKKTPLLYPNLGGTIPDYVFTRLLGIPSIWVPYAPHDEANHAPNESTTVRHFMNGIRTSASFLYEVANLRHMEAPL